MQSDNDVDNIDYIMLYVIVEAISFLDIINIDLFFMGKYHGLS